MASSSAIFDRDEIRNTIEAECLRESGASGVLVCPQKAGKSHLLSYIWSESTLKGDCILCVINMDYLSAGVAKGKLSDDTFLEYFLRRMRSRIREWIAEQGLQEDNWKQELDKAKTFEAAAAGAGTGARAVDQTLGSPVQYYTRRLKELNTLRSLVITITELLGQSPISMPDVEDVLYDLEDVGKRVVLFIDDYDQVIKQKCFSNGLFSFLRGADHQKHLITLVSARRKLTDEELHGGDLERSQLFNHFLTQTLQPFSEAETELFLDWPVAPVPPLAPAEKAYLREIGGGLPFFLRIAKDQFLRKKRPLPSGREAFERELAVMFESAFRDIWLRCNRAERTALRELAAGKAGTLQQAVQDLEQGGYLINKKIFSRLFAEFIAGQPDEDPLPDFGASAVIAYEVFPTALSYAKPKEPLVIFSLTNSTHKKASFRLNCELQDYSLERPQLVGVDAFHDSGERQELPVVLRPERVRTLQAPVNTQVKYRAEVTNPENRLLLEGVETIRVLPADHFILARRNRTSAKLIDFTWLIAAWVQEEEPKLVDIRTAAARFHPLRGYPSSYNAEEVREQVKALYEALKNHGWRYDGSGLAFHKATGDSVQRVRLPGQTLDARGGNCLEGSALFASLLSASQLHPIILFLPGHAIVGWKDRDGRGAQLEFIETTLIGTSDFEDALKEGQRKYNEAKEVCDEWQQNAPEGVEEPREIQAGNFAIPVDIHQVWEVCHVVPLPNSSQP